MKHTSLSALVAGTMLVLAGPALAGNDDADLRAEIAALRAQVDKLRAATPGSDNRLSEQRANEIRALVHDVLADADTRASLLGSAITAGWDNGFKIGSTDGNYSLKIGGRVQFRFVYNNQDESPSDDHRWGFENRRTRLDFSGHIVNPNWTYQIQGDFNRDMGGFTLLDAVIGHKFSNGMVLRGGQFKPPFNFEELTSSGRQLAVERSLVNARFNVGRSQGVALTVPVGDNIRVYGMYSDGARMLNSPWQMRDTEFAVTARGEILVAGSFGQFRDFSSWEGENFGLLIGAAVHYQKDEFGTGDDGEVSDFRWTADATVKFGGASIFGAVIGRHTSADGAPSRDQFGVVVQGGVFVVPNRWELFGRYEWGSADMPGVKDLSIITAGVNHYWSKHNLKWSTDFGFALDEVNAFWASSSAGWRTDTAGKDGQFVARSQLQLAF